MTGENYVLLAGKLVRPFTKNFASGSKKLSGRLEIPTENGKAYSLKIAAWNEVAEGLSNIAEGTFIQVEGRLDESSYDGTCKSCGTAEKKYWSEVVIEDFIVGE